jgi:DNA gyrase/topoisomerase IV subunit A
MGRVLAREVHAADLVSGEILAAIKAEMSFDPEELRLLVVDPSEEILFVFDTGKVLSLSAEKIPLVSSSELNQENVYQVELRSGERLIALVPVSQVPLVDYSVQISRRGLAKSITADYFQMFVTNRNIGTGVKSKSDRNFNLTLCNQDDIYVVVSSEGFLAAFSMDQFSVSAREVIKLGMNDFLVSSFIMREEQSLAVVTRAGDVFMQSANWLSAENATGSKRRLLLSKSKAGGMQVISAEAVKPGGWGFILYEDGNIRVLQLDEDMKLLRDKSKKEQAAPQAVAFTATELFLTDK